jgi:hypothetical protein
MVFDNPVNCREYAPGGALAIWREDTAQVNMIAKSGPQFGEVLIVEVVIRVSTDAVHGLSVCAYEPVVRVPVVDFGTKTQVFKALDIALVTAPNFLPAVLVAARQIDKYRLAMVYVRGQRQGDTARRLEQGMQPQNNRASPQVACRPAKGFQELSGPLRCG